MNLKTAKQALAFHFGWDISELKDCEYQAGRFTSPVYTADGDYYSVTKGNAPEPTRRGMENFEWVEVKDGIVNGCGWKIFKAKSN